MWYTTDDGVTWTQCGPSQGAVEPSGYMMYTHPCVASGVNGVKVIKVASGLLGMSELEAYWNPYETCSASGDGTTYFRPPYPAPRGRAGGPQCPNRPREAPPSLSRTCGLRR